MGDGAPQEEEEEDLRLHDVELEKFVETLKQAPSKFNALKDEVLSVAKQLHRNLASIDAAENSAAEAESEMAIIADDQQMVEEQLKEMPPEKERARRATQKKHGEINDLAKEFIAETKAKAMHAEAIQALEAEVGLGSGWTTAQLTAKREVEREMADWGDDRKRKQQELEQIVRENQAGRHAVDSLAARAAAIQKELAETAEGIGKCEKSARHEVEVKRQRQEDIKELHEEIEYLTEEA